MLGAIACSQPASKPPPTIEYETPTPAPEPTVREIRTVQPTSIPNPTIKAAVPKLETIDTWLARSIVPADWWARFKRVAWCESRWHPASVNGQTGDVGLMQIDPATWSAYTGTTAAAMLDPVVNLDVAWRIVQYDLQRGEPAFSQWSCQP